MEIFVVGLNHTTAPVELREKLSFTSGQLVEALKNLKGLGFITEGLLLSTCNRTEVYAVAEDLESGMGDVVEFLAWCHGIARSRFEGHLYCHSGSSAVRHLFRVACGLDSMVLGETQILGQVKEAYGIASDAGPVGKILHALFEQALNVGKRAHTETGISQNAVSVSYAAVELARKVFDDLRSRSVLIIGAGKMSELTARHLTAAGVGQVVVANRTLERARELAARFSGRAAELSELHGCLIGADLVISSTGAAGVVLTKDALLKAMRARRFRPMFLIDIAVPRDIDPSCAEIENVFLYDIDDLDKVVEANFRERRKEARKVERIIDEEVARFQSWWNAQAAVPLIRSLRQKAEEIRRKELQKAFNKLPELSERQRSVIEAMTSLIVNKILNDPTVKIKEYANGKDGDVYLEAVKRLFNLEPETDTLARDAVELRHS